MNAQAPRTTEPLAMSLLVILAVFATLLTTLPQASAQATNLVINEIYYHPPCSVSFRPCPDAPAEFIEIYNPTSSEVDLTGWTLADGVEWAADPGTSLAANDFYIVADSPSGFQAAFGNPPDGHWSGKLSNSGERIALVDPGLVVVDEVTYQDTWTIDADGGGSSLQLIDAEQDNSIGYWWGAEAPSPRVSNPNVGITPTASTENFTWTVLPNEDADIDVSVDVQGATEDITLVYRIGYPGSSQTVAMTDAGNGTWQGSVPAASYEAGDLVRMQIRVNGTRIAPRADDTIDWVGTTVADPSVDSSLPVFQWFTSTQNYDYGYYERDSTFYDGVLASNGVVYDNVGFRIRGAIARSSSWTKRNWKFKLPDHHSFVIDGIDYALDSIDLQGGFADESRVREFIGHTVADEMGLVASQVQHVRVQLNGDFYGLYTLQEHPESDFLVDNGLPNATLFQGVAGAYQAGPAGVSPATSVNNENWDIPEYINMLAAASVMQHNDFAHNNFIWWYDADEHQRFEGMIWDLDLSQGIKYAPTDGIVTTLEGGSGAVWWRWKNQAPVFNHVLSAPYRELYLRRLRTLADEWFGTGRYEAAVRAEYEAVAAEWQLDTAKWGFWGEANYSSQQAINRYADTWIDQFYAHILAGGPNGDIPGPQPTNPDLSIVAVPDPVDQRNEHIEIINHENTAIDISGWKLTGSANEVLPPGSVLPRNGSAYVVDNDLASGFRAVTSNRYVLAEYGQSLSDVGGSISLVDQNDQEHAATVWGAGQPPAGIILNEWNAVSPSKTLLEGDVRLGTLAGNGGDWFELVVVEDHLDLRGWRVRITDDETASDFLTFTDDEIFADLRAGTIITIAENEIVGADGTDWPEDPSYNPSGGDWWIHLVAGTAGTGGYISAGNFRVSNDNWQLSVFDADSAIRFGPAGEGVGSLIAEGIAGDEIGELEADPSPTITPISPYADGNQSTFGLPNEFLGRAQDFEALRPNVTMAGDVSCDSRLSVSDALMIAQYSAGLRAESAGCPLADPLTEINTVAADVSGDGQVNAIDALFIAQCSVGLPNTFCPD